MKNQLYLIAVFLIILWGVSYFYFNPDPIVHVLLFIALVAILLAKIKGDN